MSAPSRASSETCMKRFSKMVSRMTLSPSAMVISAMNCACRSVAKPGIGVGLDVDRLQPRAVALDRHPVVGVDHLGAGLLDLVEQRLDEVAARVGQPHLAAGHGRGHGVGAGLDPVGHDRVGRAVQLGDADDGDRRACRRPRPWRPWRSGTRPGRRSPARGRRSRAPSRPRPAPRPAWRARSRPPRDREVDLGALQARAAPGRRHSPRAGRCARPAPPAPSGAGRRAARRWRSRPAG